LNHLGASEASAERGEERSDEQKVVSYSTVCCIVRRLYNVLGYDPSPISPNQR